MHRGHSLFLLPSPGIDWRFLKISLNSVDSLGAGCAIDSRGVGSATILLTCG